TIKPYFIVQLLEEAPQDLAGSLPREQIVSTAPPRSCTLSARSQAIAASPSEDKSHPHDPAVLFPPAVRPPRRRAGAISPRNRPRSEARGPRQGRPRSLCQA